MRPRVTENYSGAGTIHGGLYRAGVDTPPNLHRSYLLVGVEARCDHEDRIGSRSAVACGVRDLR